MDDRSSSAGADDIEHKRQRILNPTLVMGAALAAVSTAALVALPLYRAWMSAAEMAGMTACSVALVLLALWKRGLPATRVALFVLIGTCLCGIVLTTAGLNRPGVFVGMQMLLVFAVLLLGQRPAWLFLSFMTAVLVLLAALHTTSVLSPRVPGIDATNVRIWAGVITVFVLCSACSIACISYIVRLLEAEVGKRRTMSEQMEEQSRATIAALTAQRNLEQRLAQSQKTEAMGTLAGGIAHDFNNLLAVIIGTVELAKRQTEGTPVEELLQDALEAAQRGATLTLDLLAISRQHVLVHTSTQLSRTVHESLRLVKRLVPSNVAIVIEEVDESVWVDASPIELDQVILNLSVNARDAMLEGGRISLSVTRAPSGGDDCEFGVLRVRDTGIGMSPETAARIFEPFFTTKRPGAGTGLGLAVVNGLVSARGGRIDVESVQGGGTSFSVFFPVADRPAHSQQAKELAAVSTTPSSQRVLVAEDDPSVQRMLTRVLRQAGYDTIVCGNGEEALAQLTSLSHVALVITDVIMPGIDGGTLHDRAAATHPNVPFLFCSGYTATLLPGDLITRPGRDFLAKPFTPEMLLAKVRALLAQEVPRRAVVHSPQERA